MKKYRITYKDNYFDNKQKYIIVFAETIQGANNFFFNNYTGIIFKTEFIRWI